MTFLDSIREQTLAPILAELSPDRLWARRPGRALSICAFTFVGCVMLGGGTRGGFLSDAVLELLAIPALLMAVTSLADAPGKRMSIRADIYWALAFCFVIALLPLIQLVPLPPFIWTRLPGGQDAANVFGLLERPLPWRPISISPNATWMSFLALLPPMAVFLSAIQLDYRDRRKLSLVVIAAGVASVFLGLTQVAQGPASALRFFTFTNAGEAVGFFANRNHFAALMYVALLYTAVWVIDLGFKSGSWTDVRSLETSRIMTLTISFLILIAFVAGEIMARSRAGLGLTMLALLAIYALAFTDRRNVAGAKTAKLLVAATALLVIFVVQFGLYRVLDRFTTDPLQNARAIFAHTTIRAALSFLPFGAGMGTFVPVYQMFERPIDTIAKIYANHAHNDFLELWLETGIMGPLLIGLFAIWFGFRTIKIWRRSTAQAGALDDGLARAATIAILLLVAHSVVDYPMRTEAIMAVFAISCAFLIDPFRSSEEPLALRATSGLDAPRRKAETGRVAGPVAVSARLAVSPDSQGPAAKVPAAKAPSAQVPAVTTAPRPPAGLWGENVEWHKEWKNSAEARRAGEPDRESGSRAPPDSDPNRDA